MHDLNWKTWGLVFIIALGVTFEVIKLLPTSKSWNTENFRAPHVKPYAAKRGTRPMHRQQPPAFLPVPAVARPAVAAIVPAPEITKDQLAKLVAGSAGKLGETSFDKDGKKTEDEWEIVIDPKTGKMVKRKKKKKKVAKKKEEEKKKEEPKTEEKIAKQEEPDKDATEQDIDAAITNSLNTGNLTPMPKDKPDSAFESAEEWIKKLLARPNLAETNRFIDHYKKNLVTTEVFYKVVNTMLDDSRPEMKKLGIHAAAAVPNVMSFQILVAASGNSRNDSGVRAKAEEALKSYTHLARLEVLKKILKSGTPADAAVKAANLVKTSAETNLTAQTSSGGTAGQSAQQVQARARTTFQNFVPVLGNLSRTAADEKVKQAAGETLAFLESKLSGSTAVAQQ